MKQATQSLVGETSTIYDITVQNADAPGLPAVRKPAVAKATASKGPTSDLGDDSGRSPADTGVDIVLRETERILADYIHAEESHPAMAQR